MIPENSFASEASETATAVSWIALLPFSAIKFTFHPASEAKRSMAMGANLKAQGMLPGIPDLVNPVYPFLLEMKVKRNAPSAYQAWWLNWARDLGIASGVAYNADEAIEFFQAVMRGDAKNSTASVRLDIMAKDWIANSMIQNPWDSRMNAVRRGR